jgi:uncharacterized surface protein with fasciclin (FAS1) repeats
LLDIRCTLFDVTVGESLRPLKPIGGTMKRIALPAVLIMGVFVLGACADTPVDPVSSSVEGSIEALYAKASPRGAPAPGTQSIAAIAIDAGFSELVGALVYVDEELDAGLVDLFLNGTDQYTVFAPTDAAFEALYGALGDDVDGITDLPAALVLDVLLYHVVEGRRAANSVVPPVRPRTITTLLGATFTVDRNGVITDIAGQEVNFVPGLINISASNGIIHVIDTVLLPLPPD